MKHFNPKAGTKKWLKYAAVAVLLFTAVSCEDEPLLEPSTQSSEGGSYKRMTFPDSNQNNIINYTEKNNPEVF